MKGESQLIQELRDAYQGQEHLSKEEREWQQKVREASTDQHMLAILRGQRRCEEEDRASGRTYCG